MKKEEIESMLNGIDDKFIEEAVVKTNNKHKLTTARKFAAAAVIFLVVAGTGMSVLAATNPSFKKWITRNQENDRDFLGHKGVDIKIAKQDKDSDKDKQYYLVTDYIPEGYRQDKECTSSFQKKGVDTIGINIYFFHLDADFVNILPQSKEIKKIETDKYSAYIATSKWENRYWVVFNEANYMVEGRDRAKQLTKEEIIKIINGMSLTTKKPKVIYKMYNWTQEDKESYENYLDEQERRFGHKK